MFKLDPNKCNGKMSVQMLMNYIDGCLRNDEGNPGGEKSILLFAHASSKFKYIFCGRCDCDDMQPTATDATSSGGGYGNIVLNLVEFEQLAGYECKKEEGLSEFLDLVSGRIRA